MRHRGVLEKAIWWVYGKNWSVYGIFLENHAQKYGEIMVGEEKCPYGTL